MMPKQDTGITCLCCAGKKVVPVEVREPRKPVQHIELACIWCGGAGTMTANQAHNYRAAQDAWCRCGNPSGRTSYQPDTPGFKHHWTCDDCGKVVQCG